VLKPFLTILTLVVLGACEGGAPELSLGAPWVLPNDTVVVAPVAVLPGNTCTISEAPEPGACIVIRPGVTLAVLPEEFLSPYLSMDMRIFAYLSHTTFAFVFQDSLNATDSVTVIVRSFGREFDSDYGDLKWLETKTTPDNGGFWSIKTASEDDKTFTIALAIYEGEQLLTSCTVVSSNKPNSVGMVVECT
jgi:hypothetical protein